jgi:hypothetical protein
MDFHMLLQWVYPIIDLVIVVCCLIYIRNFIGTLLAVAFSLNFLVSVLWRIPRFMGDIFGMDMSLIYSVLGVINPLIVLISAGFIIMAIIKIGELVNNKQVAQHVVVEAQTAAGSPLADLNSIQTDTVKPVGNILLYLLPMIFGVISILLGIILLFDRYNEEEALAVVGFGVLIMLIASIYFLMILYRLWSYTISQSRKLGLNPSIESPAKAVGFLFIPLFNYYWIFIAYGKLAKDLNAIAEKKGFARGMPDIIGVLVALFMLLGLIPFLGYLTSFIAVFVLIPVFLYKAIKMVSALESIEQDQIQLIDSN